MNITIILVILIGVGVAGMGVEGYLLKQSYERNGALEVSNQALQGKLLEINNVLKQVDKTHSTNVALPDDKLFDGLLPKPPMVSGDLSCIWTKTIDVTPQQVDVMKKDPNNWRPLAVQIKDHNDNRFLRCEASVKKP